MKFETYTVNRGIGKGDKGDMSPFEIATLNFFLSEQYGIYDIKSNFQHIFLCFGDFAQTPPGALCLYGPRWWQNPLFHPPVKQIAAYAPDC